MNDLSLFYGWSLDPHQEPQCHAGGQRPLFLWPGPPQMHQCLMDTCEYMLTVRYVLKMHGWYFDHENLYSKHFFYKINSINLSVYILDS